MSDIALFVMLAALVIFAVCIGIVSEHARRLGERLTALEERVRTATFKHRIDPGKPLDLDAQRLGRDLGDRVARLMREGGFHDRR